jgi:hypothetical protein
MSTVYQAAASGTPMPGGAATPPGANGTQQAPDSPAATDEAEGAEEAETGDTTSSKAVSNPHQAKAKELEESDKRLAEEASQLTENNPTTAAEQQQQQLRLAEIQAEQTRLNAESKNLQQAMLREAQQRVAEAAQQLAAQQPQTAEESQQRDLRLTQLQGVQNQLAAAERQINNNSGAGGGQRPAAGPSGSRPANPAVPAQGAQAPAPVPGAQQSPFSNVASNPQQLRNFSDEARKQHDAQRMRYFIALQLMLQQAQQFADEAEAMERQLNGQAAAPSQTQQPVTQQAPVQSQPMERQLNGQAAAPSQTQQPATQQAPVQSQPMERQSNGQAAAPSQTQQPATQQAPVQSQQQAPQAVAPQAPADTTAADQAEAAKRAEEAERLKTLEAENNAYRRQVLKDKANTLYNASRGYYGKSQKDFNEIMSGLSPQERAEINTLYSEVASERSRGRNTNTLEQDLLANKPYWSGYSTMTDLNQTQQHLLMSSLHGNNPQEQARVMRDTLMPDGNGWWRWKQTQKAVDHAVKGMSDQQFGQFINTYGAQNFVNDMLKIQSYSYLDQSDINAHLNRARQYQ